jgi:hypothetical protein
MKIIFKNFCSVLFFIFFVFSVNAEELKGAEKKTELGFSYNHLSKASLGDKNPDANIYMFNFFKNF